MREKMQLAENSHVASSKHVLFATRTAVASAKPSPWSSDVPLARLCGHLRPGPPLPPGLCSGSNNISILNKRQNMQEWAVAVLRSQTNLSSCQGRNLRSPPFSSSRSLCMEMDLPWVICSWLKLKSLAPCRSLLGNNIGFSSELLGGRHRAAALCIFSSLLGAVCCPSHSAARSQPLREILVETVLMGEWKGCNPMGSSPKFLDLKLGKDRKAKL